MPRVALPRVALIPLAFQCLIPPRLCTTASHPRPAPRPHSMGGAARNQARKSAPPLASVIPDKRSAEPGPVNQRGRHQVASAILPPLVMPWLDHGIHAVPSPHQKPERTARDDAWGADERKHPAPRNPRQMPKKSFVSSELRNATQSCPRGVRLCEAKPHSAHQSPATAAVLRSCQDPSRRA